MPVNIIHKDGVYNFYDTVSDGAWFVSGLTLEQLTEYYRERYGESAMAEFPRRLARAQERGTSCMISRSLESCVSCNRAGHRETHLPVEDFVAQFLTIAPEVEDEQA